MQSTDKRNDIKPKTASALQILAIDTSGKGVSVALLNGENVVYEMNSRDLEGPQTSPPFPSSEGDSADIPEGFSRKRSKGKTKSKRIFPPGASILLAPMIKEALAETKVKLNDIGLVALTVGPGLFTGLRVGVVTAKAFAYSSGADLIGVNTLELLAVKAANENPNSEDKAKKTEIQRIRPVINAQRKQLFSGCFRSIGDWEVERLEPPAVLGHEEWLSTVGEQDLVTGTGLQPIADENQHLNLAPSSCWETNATSVGIYAWHQYRRGVRDDFWKIQPLYFRPSAAEEVRNERLKQESK